MKLLATAPLTTLPSLLLPSCKERRKDKSCPLLFRLRTHLTPLGGLIWKVRKSRKKKLRDTIYKGGISRRSEAEEMRTWVSVSFTILNSKLSPVFFCFSETSNSPPLSSNFPLLDLKKFFKVKSSPTMKSFRILLIGLNLGSNKSSLYSGTVEIGRWLEGDQ